MATALDLNLLTTGLGKVLGADVVLSHPGRSDENSRLYCGLNIEDLFRQTHIMRPPYSLTLPEPSELFDFNVSRLSGTIQSIRLSGNQTIEEAKAEIERIEGTKKEQMSLVYSGEVLDDTRTLSDYGIRPEETLFSVPCLPDGRPSLSYVFDESFLDPTFHFDLSNAKDDGKKYMRGGFEYKRPYGWNRLAMKVIGKYENDAWLGPDGLRTKEDPGEWPVSYHGTDSTSAKLIVKQGYKSGPRMMFGKGIYTSPSLEMVERLYAQEFTHDGKTYKIALQNRVNPDQQNDHLRIIPASETGAGADYWLSPKSQNNDVRPYGILIREVQANTSEANTSEAKTSKENTFCILA